MKGLITRGVGLVLGLLVMLGVILPAAVAAEIHYNGGFVISHKNVPLRGGFYVMPPDYQRSRPILFPYYFPTTTPVTPGGYQAFYYPLEPPTEVGPYGVPLSALPWNRPGFPEYNEPAAPPRTKQLGHPQKYQLRAATVARWVPDAPPNVAIIVAHLPAGAPIWVEDQQMTSTGPRRYFVSPPLTAGKRYFYTVRAAWAENGKWVDQSLDIPVRAGKMTAVYLERNTTPVTKAR